jgi:mRNA interferase MazF
LTPPIGPVPEILVAYISSVLPPELLPSDIILDPEKEESSTMLKTKSVVRLHKLATIHTNSIVRRLGNLSNVAATEVDSKLSLLLQL